MSERNYLKKLYYERWCGMWCIPVACEGYKMVNDVAADVVDSLHVKRITLNEY
jgi:hypothetical protein